jgi:GTP pyrophosphokinase
MRNPDEFLETVKSDLFESEIYVFTPKGDVKELPEGATPIDFAYAIHTDVGSQCVAARVNGKLVPMKTKLKSGDILEVVTSKTQKPSKDWLNFCVTTKAQAKIRLYLKEEQRKRALEMGRDLIEKALRKINTSPGREFKGDVYEKFLKDNGLNSYDDLCIEVGYGKITPSQLVEKIGVASGAKSAEKEKPSFLQKVFRSAAGKNKDRSLIRVDGMDDLLVRYAKCCNPIPGDPIVGFITLGRGITIHTASCGKAFALDQDRQIDVAWSGDSTKQGLERLVRVRVMSQDTRGLLQKMTEVFTTKGVNIHNAQIKTTRDKKAICVFDVSVRDTKHLSDVMLELQKIQGVMTVNRVANG